MKKSINCVLSMVIAFAISSSTLLACTAAPRPNLATEASCQTKCPEKEKERGPFVIDNFKIISGALEKLGVAPDELQAMIKEGKKLPEVLEAKNIKVDRFKKALLKEYNQAIQKGVEDKKLTKAEGKMLRQAIKEKIMNWLEK